MRFTLLDTPAQPDRIIEIIKAIGSTWPLILTLSSIAFIIIYKKQIGEFFTNLKRISGKTPIGEIILENSSIASIASTEHFAPKSDAPKLQDDDKLVDDRKSNKENFSFLQIYKELAQQNIKNAESIFSKMQNEETNSDDRERNSLLFLFFKYVCAGINTINELKERAENSTSSVMKYYCYEYLAGCYSHVNNYEEALIYGRKAYALAADDGNKADTARQISNCLYELGKKTESIDFLKNVIAEITTTENKQTIYRSLADLFDKEQNWVSKSIALEMALSCSPNNTTLLFDAAFAYTNSYKNSSEQIPSLALVHYKELIQYDSKSYAGYNNLGVAFSSFGLEGLAVANYKKAVELGNTLAAGNLSYKYIHAGLYDEARMTLSKAKEAEDIHETVWSAFEHLSRKEKEESEKSAALLAKAKEELKFIRKFGEAYFDNITSQVNLVGDWVFGSTPVQIKQLANPQYFELKWTDKEYDFTITIQNIQIALVSHSGNCHPSGIGINEKTLAFVAITPDQQSMTILLYVLSEPSRSHFFTFTKKIEG